MWKRCPCKSASGALFRALAFLQAPLSQKLAEIFHDLYMRQSLEGSAFGRAREHGGEVDAGGARRFGIDCVVARVEDIADRIERERRERQAALLDLAKQQQQLAEKRG